MSVVAEPLSDSDAEPRPQIGLRRSSLFLSLGLLMLSGTASAVAGTSVPLVSPLLGLVCVVGVPTVLVYGALGVPDPTERLGISVLVVIFAVMGAGLVANTVLPHLGVRGPLGQAAVLTTTDVLCGAIGAAAWSRHPRRYRVGRVRLTAVEWRLGALSAALVPMAAVGAVRLNNGLGGGVTLAMLGVTVVDMALLVARCRQLRSTVVSWCIYCISLALLFMTSLRGWYTTGHDIQREMRVFVLTQSHASWNMSRLQDAYNACLSITVLPTMLWQWTRMDPVYVYKVIFQLLFALCPVLVYRLSRRFSDRPTALLATIYFVSFVTFFQDMPMLNRQEIAFLFLVGGLVVLFERNVALRKRRVTFYVMTVGMVMAHYSTTYVTIGMLSIAWAAGVALSPLQWVLARRRPHLVERFPVLQPLQQYAIGLVVVAFAAAAAFIWSTPVTHTESALSHTIIAVVKSLRDGSDASRSLDTNYSIVSSSKPSPKQLLAIYDRVSVRRTAAARADGVYYSSETIARYPAPAADPAQLPLTTAGKALSRVGIDVASLNYTTRQGSARLLQLLVIVGLIAVVVGRRRVVTAPVEFVCLAGAALVIILLQVFLPVLSVDYGLLRSFQQALVVLGVFLVAGSMAMFPRRLGRWGVAGATVLALAFFASSTGMMAQSTGGYGPQLHLNNAGLYYDLYYLHPQEVAGFQWLASTTRATAPRETQPEIQMDRYAFGRSASVTPLNANDELYPALLRKNAYVFLGYANVTSSESTINFSGNNLTYHYPLNFLDDNKDLIYSNGGSRVYR